MSRSYKNLPAGDLRLKLNRMREERSREGKDLPPEPHYNYHRDPDREEEFTTNRPVYRGRAPRWRGRGRGRNTILNELNTGSPMKITVELRDDGSRTCTVNEDETFDYPAARGHYRRGRGRAGKIDDGSRICTVNEDETFDFRGHYTRGRGRGGHVRRRGGDGGHHDDHYYSRGRRGSRGRPYRPRSNYRGRGGRGRGRGASANEAEALPPEEQDVPENPTGLLEEEQWEGNCTTALEDANAGDEDFYHQEDYDYDDYYHYEDTEGTGESLQDELQEALQKEADVENEASTKKEEEVSKKEEKVSKKEEEVSKKEEEVFKKKEIESVKTNKKSTKERKDKIDKKGGSSTKKENESTEQLEGKVENVDYNNKVKNEKNEQVAESSKQKPQ